MSEPVQDGEEERVAVAVVQGDLRGRAGDHQPPGRVDPEPAGHGRVRLEIGEVVLLLQPRVAAELRRPGSVARETLGGDGLGDDDARGGAAAELVLEPRELVVEGGGARDPERAGGQRQVV